MQPGPGQLVAAAEAKAEPGSFSLSLGCLRVQIESPKEVVEKARGRFGAFFCPQPAQAPHLWVRIENQKPYPRAAPTAGYVRHETPQGFLLQSRHFCAQVDLPARRAWLAGNAFPESLDVLLRNLLPWLASPGLVLHGALLQLEEGVVVCCGASGAGKSTLAKLAQAGALCDELTLVEAAADGAFQGTALPFWEARPGQGMLRAVLVLTHARENRLARMTPSQAVPLLASHVLWPTYCAEAMAAAFASLMAVVRQLPVFSFGFRPEASAYRYLWNAFPPEKGVKAHADSPRLAKGNS